MSNFLDELNVRYVPEDEIKRYDPQMRSFYNANTPQEWEKIKSLL